MAELKYGVHLNLNENELQNAKMQILSSDPSGFEGHLYYNSSSNILKFHNGTEYVSLSSASGDITGVTAGDGLSGGGSSGGVTLTVNVDDSSIETNSDTLRVKASGITNAMLAGSIAASKLAGSIGDSKLSQITTANKVDIGALDIDGATDIGAALVDADLFIVDDGANGTERKATMSRLATYMQSALTFTTNTNTVDMGDGFVIEDADGTEVTIDENKEVKFIGAGGLTINWTDVSTGSDGDPYDLTFTIGTLNQDTTGSAATLTTARNIGGVSFDGSANIDLPGVNSAGDQDTSGNAATATKLATARSFTTSGDVVVASTNFDGSGNFTAAATIQANAVEGSMLNDNVISGQTDIGANIASTDEILISDAGSLRRSDVSRLTTFLQSALTFTTNTDADVSVANLKTALGDGFPSNAVTIGDADDVVTIANDLTVSGDLTVTGDTITTNTTTITTKDPIIRLANNNAADAIDIGFYGTYVSTIDSASATRYSGLFRDASEDTDSWTLFKDVTAEPTTTVNTSGTAYALADLKLGTLKATSVQGTLATASQTNITGVGTITTGVWNGTAIASAYIAGDAITGAKIADDAIDSEHYTDGSIDTAHIAADAVTGAKIADDAINSEHYTDASIDTAHIGDDQVTYAKIQNVSATNRILGRDSSGAGVIEEITPANLRTMLNVENGATADQSKSDIDGLAITTVGTLDTGDATAVVSAASTSAAGKVELATTAEALAGTDTSRAVTAAGLAARSFKDTIGDGSATAIVVNHALGTRDVIVQLYDASSYETCIAQVVRTDANNVTVTFNSAPANNDIIALVTKVD